MINCLNFTVKHLTDVQKSGGKDEELHRKMDRILEKLERQEENEKKPGLLNTAKSEERILTQIRNIADEFGESAKMKHVIDSVETSVGYLELFVQDFERIHEKMQELDKRCSLEFEKLKSKLMLNNQENTDKQKNLQEGMTNIGEKICKIEQNLERMVKNEQTLHGLGENIKKLEQEIKGKMELEKNNLKQNGENTKKQAKSSKTTKPKETTTLQGFGVRNNYTRRTTERNYKCWSCSSILPKDLPFMEDKVSVTCPGCWNTNIVTTTKFGFKWMYTFCNGAYHYQEFSQSKKESDLENCQVCGKTEAIHDASTFVTYSLQPFQRRPNTSLFCK